jgi:23S rRNA (adenine2503-C2)-methyltransferase
MNPLTLTHAQFAAAFKQRYGGGDPAAAALYRAIFKSPNPDAVNLPAFAGNTALADAVQREIRIVPPRIVGRESEEGTEKLQLQLSDGQCIESVIIPMGRYMTVCVSSQVGCRMGCRFCRTGKMGLRRALTADEIVAQVYIAKVLLGLNVRNVVFMGMGEPLDNIDALIQAIRVINDQRGLDIALRHITVSTAGLTGGISRLAAQGWPQLNLAVSLNTAEDALRNRLMPVNRRHCLAELKSTLERYPLAKGTSLFIEYILLKDINDAPHQAHLLADYLSGLRVKVNLIPYNSEADDPLRPPGDDAVRRFQCILAERGIFVRKRTARGARIRAACGQLGQPDRTPGKNGLDLLN